MLGLQQWKLPTPCQKAVIGGINNETKYRYTTQKKFNSFTRSKRMHTCFNRSRKVKECYMDLIPSGSKMLVNSLKPHEQILNRLSELLVSLIPMFNWSK